MIGDRLCDIEAGLAAGGNAICLDPTLEIPTKAHHCHSFGEILNIVGCKTIEHLDKQL